MRCMQRPSGVSHQSGIRHAISCKCPFRSGPFDLPLITLLRSNDIDMLLLNDKWLANFGRSALANSIFLFDLIAL